MSLLSSVALTVELISGREHFPSASLAMLCAMALLFLLFFAFNLLTSIGNR
jgi:hypothetical protein